MGDLIRTTAELESVCAQARTEGLLSVDTEFVWRRTYRPQLGIVQLGTREKCQAVDVTSGLSPASLGDVLADSSVVKILHDARQDLTHLRHYTGRTPANVFDTQLAAAFAGFPAGIGLQKLLLEAIDVGLPKTETCTDWLQRPLSPAQVQYALDDVRYLPALRDELLARCESFGTRAWLEEDLLTYDDASLYDDYDPEQVWKRVKTGRVRLEGVGFAVLRAVAALREEMAQGWNLPRNWLGDDESLVAMASLGRVGRLVHRLKGGQADVARAKYAKAVAAALALPEEEWPENPRRRYIPEVLDAADKALDWLRGRAEELHVDATVIANRATVTAFVDDVEDATSPLASGWRADAVGRDMASLFGVD